MSPPLSQSSAYNNINNGRNTNDRRSASLNPHHREVQRDRTAPNQSSMFHYGDRSDELHQPTRSAQQQREFDPSINRHYQPKQRTYVTTLISIKILLSSIENLLFVQQSIVITIEFYPSVVNYVVQDVMMN